VPNQNTMFIRTKRVKEHDYAYLVKNKWTKNGPRQKTIKYLGPVFCAPYLKEISMEKFLEPTKIEHLFIETPIAGIYKILIERELIRHGFIKKDENVYIYEDIIVNLNARSVRKGRRNIAMKMNEGFLCHVTMNNIFEHTQQEDETGKKLAEDILGAGIAIEKDMFVRIFNYLKAPE